MPVDKNVKRTPSSSLCLTNLLLHMFVSRLPISLFPVVPRLGIALPDQYVSLCPMLVLHFQISLFPVVSHVGITLPELSVSRCSLSRYHAPRSVRFLLCPMSVSRSQKSLFPVASHVGVTLPSIIWTPTWDATGNRPIGERDTEMGHRETDLYYTSVSLSFSCRYHDPRSVCFPV